jgi:hypothetical protein
VPFVNQEHRETPDTTIAGDRCYLHYKHMMQRWQQDPRWTTIDKLATCLSTSPDIRAEILAFLVFFHFHATPYEETKRQENGDIL